MSRLRARSRQLVRVALPGDQRLKHRPTGDPENVGGDRGELDSGVLEELLQALDLMLSRRFR